MNVRELIQELMQYPEDCVVILSSDSEGNNYSPVTVVDRVQYVAESSCYGRLFDPDEEEEEEGNKSVEAVALWPAN